MVVVRAHESKPIERWVEVTAEDAGGWVRGSSEDLQGVTRSWMPRERASGRTTAVREASATQRSVTSKGWAVAVTMSRVLPAEPATEASKAEGFRS